MKRLGEKGDWTDANGGYSISDVDDVDIASDLVLRVCQKIWLLL